MSSVAFLVIFNTLTIPFALPKLRKFLGAPYLPSSRNSFRAVLDNIPGISSKEGLRMVDVGSGDGRLVDEAARHGMHALGIELNPWLVGVSRMRLWYNRRAMKYCPKILWVNAWESERELVKFSPDIVTFYGRPGQGVMGKFGQLAERISDETGKTIYVVSNKFHIPNWNLRQIALVDQFIVYKLHSNKE